jgi:LysR family transcriptional regulator, transcription activator of glutamate synthase operon
MELRHLRAFVTVAEHGSFTRAAELLHVAQPSLSQQIRALERELGVPLFERTSRTVRLTAAGAILLPHARRALAAVDDARHDLAEQTTTPSGPVRLGTTPTVAIHLLPSWLTGFLRRYPAIEVRLLESGALALEGDLVNGAIDLAVITLPAHHASLQVEPILDEDLLLGVARGHPFARRDAVALEEAAGEPFVLYREGYGLRESVLSACHQAGFRPRVVLDGGETETVLRLCAAGLGVTLVPRLALDGSPERPVGVPLRAPTPRRTLALAWRDERYLTRAARALRDDLLGNART